MQLYYLMGKLNAKISLLGKTVCKTKNVYFRRQVQESTYKFSGGFLKEKRKIHKITRKWES